MKFGTIKGSNYSPVRCIDHPFDEFLRISSFSEGKFRKFDLASSDCAILSLKEGRDGLIDRIVIFT